MKNSKEILIRSLDRLEFMFWEYNVLKNDIVQEINMARYHTQFMSNDELYKSQKVLEQIENIAEKM